MQVEYELKTKTLIDAWKAGENISAIAFSGASILNRLPTRN